jgi:hypothetical protein
MRCWWRPTLAPIWTSLVYAINGMPETNRRQAAQTTLTAAGQVQVQKVREHHHATRQHGSAVCAEHEFFAEVCNALERAPEVLVLSAHTTGADFRHYVGKHRPAPEPRIAGWEIAERQTDAQVLSHSEKMSDGARLARSCHSDD